jgi:transposase
MLNFHMRARICETGIMNSQDQPKNRIVIGIDVAKQTLDFATPDASGTVPNTSAGIEKLRQKLPEPGQAVIVLESTGGYEHLVVAELVARGHHVARVNPRQVRRFAEAMGILAKTDRIDALGRRRNYTSRGRK